MKSWSRGSRHGSRTPAGGRDHEREELEPDPGAAHELGDIVPSAVTEAIAGRRLGSLLSSDMLLRSLGSHAGPAMPRKPILTKLRRLQSAAPQSLSLELGGERDVALEADTRSEASRAVLRSQGRENKAPGCPQEPRSQYPTTSSSSRFVVLRPFPLAGALATNQPRRRRLSTTDRGTCLAPSSGVLRLRLPRGTPRLLSRRPPGR
jgi:hypothetical protein